MSDETPRLKLAAIPEGVQVTADLWNEALTGLDALLSLCLKGLFVNAPPAGAADGDAYVVGGAPTGAWTGYAYKIASCLDGGWRFFTPCDGLAALLTTTNTVLVYRANAWTAVASADFATRSGAETLSNKTFSGATAFPGGAWSATGAVGIGVAAPYTKAHVHGVFTVDNGAPNGDGTLAPRVNAVCFGRNDQAAGSFSHYMAYASAGARADGNILVFDLCNGTESGHVTPLVLWGSNAATPGSDNAASLGLAAWRWSVVYAGTGTINTSDSRAKTNVRALSAAEMRAARRIGRDICVWQFLDAVGRKGVDGARLHVGCIADAAAGFAAARSVEAILAEEGLDPARYGFWCKDAAGEADAVFGLRYTELLCFLLAAEIAAREAEAAATGAALAALAARVAALEAG